MTMKNCLNSNAFYTPSPGTFPRFWRWIAISLISCCFGTVMAENLLENIAYSALPGGSVEITMKFSEAAPDPKVFTTENRIAFDFSDTRNGLTQRRIEIGTGSTSGVSVVEAAGRTRVVVDLFRSTPYEKKLDGDKLVLTVSNMGGASAVANSAAMTDPTKTVASTDLEIANVDFRRGKGGEGRIIVHFSGEGGNADMRREGDKIVVDMLGVKLPAKFAQRLDVVDFATPVQFIDTKTRGANVRMEVVVAGTIAEPSAYQTGTEYVLEIGPVREASAEKKDNTKEPEYTGDRVVFNFQDIPTRSVLQLIAETSGFNVVVADSVQGSITLRLNNVPWDQALDIILQTKGLDKRQQGNVIWIAPQKEIAEREAIIQQGKERQEKLVDLVSDYIPISYAKASAIAALVSKGAGAASKAPSASSPPGASNPSPVATSSTPQGFLSERGSVTFDERTNTLIVNDTPEKVKEIRGLVVLLDRPVQQVLIESRIVIASDSFSKEIGTRFGVSGGYEDRHGNVTTTSGSSFATDTMTNLALDNRFNGRRGLPVSVPGSSGSGVSVPSLADRLNVNMPIASPAGSFGLAILGGGYLLDLELSAAQREGRSEVISSPRVITASQQEAVIKQGREVGYVTSSGGGNSQATVQFKEAVLELKVTPTITADRRVSLILAVKKDAIAEYISVPGGGLVPSLEKREVNTAVLVDNGQTVVLGGIYEVTSNEDLKKVPLLGDVPGVGNLFRNTNKRKGKAELLIFVTPRILDESLK